MIYEIDGKYYIKSANNFLEVEIYLTADGDVDLRPKCNKLEYSKNLKFREINFMSEKETLLKELKNNTFKKDNQPNEKEIKKEQKKFFSM